MASTLKRHQCAVCDTRENLSRCSACRSVHYCSRDHQATHRSSHKDDCKQIKRTRDSLEHEERELRALPPGFDVPPHIFEDGEDGGVGHFWGMLCTRDYMRARWAHIDALSQVRTYEAIEAAVNHCLDMHRLCRSDNMGIRYSTPHLLLRLGKDQEAYDFLKWYALINMTDDYDYGDMTLPFLDIKGADVFENVTGFMPRFSALSHVVAVTLTKLRLLIDLRALQNSNMMRGKLPQELIDKVREQLVSNPVRNNKDILHSDDLTPRIKEIETQVDQLYDYVKRQNKFFWPALVDPLPHLGQKPEYYSFGNEAEMQLILNYSYLAWEETPGAIDAIRQKMAGGV